VDTGRTNSDSFWLEDADSPGMTKQLSSGAGVLGQILHLNVGTFVRGVPICRGECLLLLCTGLPELSTSHWPRFLLNLILTAAKILPVPSPFFAALDLQISVGIVDKEPLILSRKTTTC
jgi:hypothetical protein